MNSHLSPRLYKTGKPLISYLLGRKIQYDISSMSALVNRDPDDCPTSALSYQQKPSKEMLKATVP